MKPYGVKRNWNNDILVKNGVAQRRKTHTKWKKLMHRKARRTDRYTIRREVCQIIKYK